MTAEAEQGWRKLHHWRNTTPNEAASIILRPRIESLYPQHDDPVDHIEMSWTRGYGWKYCEWTEEATR